MGIGTIITMASIGVASAVGEKLLNNMGKTDMASLLNITGLSSLGVTAIAIVIKLLKTIATLA